MCAFNKGLKAFYAVTTIAFVFLVCQCKSSTPQHNLEAERQALVKKELGDSVSVTLNSSKTYALYQQKPSISKIGVQHIQYMVLRLSDNMAVHKGSFMRGHVQWINDDTIEEFNLPGKVQGNEDTSKFKKHVNVLNPKKNSSL